MISTRGSAYTRSGYTRGNKNFYDKHNNPHGIVDFSNAENVGPLSRSVAVADLGSF